ncbi:MAG: phosphatase PAP2 family protein, partial [Muribaculaceae bacterium]|nr:phosphatase PAP2 family protein [Muribaculaceae bacterium]
MLIKTLKLTLNIHASTLKKIVYRKRPFVQLGEPAPYSGNDWPAWGESSYPSCRALLGWGIALALTEVMPDCQNELLKRGYEYGESRIILGSNYASDVIAARVMAACDLGKIHNETVFKTLLENAKNEYRQKLDEASIESIIATSRANDTLWYSLTGIIYHSKPATPGIYIHNGKKVTIQ